MFKKCFLKRRQLVQNSAWGNKEDTGLQIYSFEERKLLQKTQERTEETRKEAERKQRGRGQIKERNYE
jgi:hypothetical protein